MDASVTVVGPKRVKLRDDEVSLTAATVSLLQLPYAVAPGPNWTDEGRTIRDWYEDAHSGLTE